MFQTPPLGKSALKYFPPFAPGYTNLNNGSYGSPSLSVLKAQADFQTLCGENPELWHRKQYLEYYQIAVKAAARFIDSEPERTVLVYNTTYGVQSVLDSFSWQSGDLILINNVTYESVRNQVQRQSDRFGIVPLIIDLKLPATQQEIVSQFTTFLAANSFQLSKIKLSIFDVISSAPAICFPVKELLSLFKSYKIPVLLDGAHAIGQYKELSINQLQPDFFISNFHKWGFNARTCAVLYTSKDFVKTLRPCVTGTHYDSILKSESVDLLANFVWPGTNNFSAFCTIPEAIKFRESLGGEERIWQYCHNLALTSGKWLAERWNTVTMEREEAQTGYMTNVMLYPAATKDGSLLSWKLMEKAGTYVPCFPFRGQWWIRISFMVWNEFDDVLKLALAIESLYPPPPSHSLNTKL